MTGNQLSAARALLGWTQKQLSEAAGVSVPTIKRAEGASKTVASAESIRQLVAALERAGVEFISENGHGIGVRLKKVSR